MKNYKLLLLIACWALSSCYKDDVSILYSRQYNLEKQLEAIKAQVIVINQDIDLINSIINAESAVDCVIGVEDLPDGSGYKLIFRKSGEKIIRHGNTPYIGDNGNWWTGNTDTGKKSTGDTPSIGSNENWWIGGVDTGVPARGNDGPAGQTPIIGVARDMANPSDLNYYWTVRTGNTTVEFILDANSNKVKAAGADGANGASPVIGIKQDTDGVYYWTVTVAPAAETWLLAANGEKVKAQGKDGNNGDSFFKSVDYSNADYVIFVLNTDPEASFKVAKEKTIAFEVQGTHVFDGYTQTQVLSFTTSDNVVAVQATVPDGWRAKVDFVSKTVTVTSPAITNNFAQMSGSLSLVAFDNKGLATSVTIAIEVGTTIRLAFIHNSWSQLTPANIPYGLRVFYFDQSNPYIKGDMPNDAVSQADAIASKAIGSKGYNTDRENKTRTWEMLTWANEPNVTWDDYNASGASSRNLLQVDASLKPHPTLSGYYMSLAHNNLFWQKNTFTKDAAVSAPTNVRGLNASASVKVNIHRADQIMIPGTSTPVDPEKLWVSFDNQGRACQFNSGDVTTVQRGSLPMTVSMAPDVSYDAGTEIVTTGLFGTFGSLLPISGDATNRSVKIRVMYEDKVVVTAKYTDKQIDMGSSYEFNINQSTYLGISIVVDGWIESWMGNIDLGA